MTPDEVRTLADGFTATAKTILERGRDLAPVAFIITPGGEIMVIGLMWDSLSAKRAAYAKLRAERAKVPGSSLVLINDVWMAKLRPGEPDPIGGPENHPERRECLQVVIDCPGFREFRSHPYHHEGSRIVWEPELAPSSGVEWSSAILGDELPDWSADPRRA